MHALQGRVCLRGAHASGAQAEAGAPEMYGQAAVTVRLVRAAARPLVWPTRSAT